MRMLTQFRIGLKCSFESSPAYEEQSPPHMLDMIQIPGGHPNAPLGLRFNNSIVFRLAQSVRNNISGDIGPYLEGFNKWLPVIDGSALNARFRNPESFQDEAFCVLLLTCTLLSKVSRPNLDEADIQGNHELYLTLAVSHANLLSKGVKTLSILQSKILLALYEHLQANHMAAMGTLGSAAAITTGMGLFRWHCQVEPEMISIESEEQRVVCCLYVLER